MSGLVAERFLLCEPTHFDVTYEINPWMRGQVVDREAAAAQWRALRDELACTGAAVDVIEAVPGLPDLVFTGDGGVAVEDTFVASSFLPPERQPEAEHFAAWFAARGYRVVRPPHGVHVEGLGDVVIQGRDAVGAYGQRSSREAVAFLRGVLPGLSFLAELELTDPRFFHLGIALALLDERTGLYVPDAFAERDRRVIAGLRERMIAVGDRDAELFAVNAIVLGRRLIVHGCTPELSARLAELGFQVVVVDVGEFVKSGGGTRCLVLPVYRRA